jgi:hypothetical protein
VYLNHWNKEFWTRHVITATKQGSRTLRQQTLKFILVHEAEIWIAEVAKQLKRCFWKARYLINYLNDAEAKECQVSVNQEFTENHQQSKDEKDGEKEEGEEDRTAPLNDL